MAPRRPASAEPLPLGEAASSGSPAANVPRHADLASLRTAATGCRACDLWRNATQTVFGEGPTPAPLMLVGEQPGDKEDIAGLPFVGPAGQLLDSALRTVGIDRERVFVTNVVKHFKWRPSGKRRLHERPNPAEVRACRPWFEAELGLVRPKVAVLLGATAAQSILGPTFRVTVDHGRLLQSPLAGATAVLATLHPSAVLRSRTEAERVEQMETLISDLRSAAAAIAG